MKNQQHKDNYKDDVLLVFLIFVVAFMFACGKTPQQAMKTYEIEQTAYLIRIQMGE